MIEIRRKGFQWEAWKTDGDGYPDTWEYASPDKSKVKEEMNRRYPNERIKVIEPDQPDDAFTLGGGL